MRTVIFEGREEPLAPLCRRFEINLRTVSSRIERGMCVEDALRRAPRAYPSNTKRNGPARPLASPDPLIKDAVDLMIDLREVLLSISPTPRRERILLGVRRWLLRAGWR